MFLIFDTETTGLPKNFKAPVSDSENWPRLVQLAWQLHDQKGELIEVKNFIVKPEGFSIPYNAEKIHGISTQTALSKGVELSFVLQEFEKALKKTSFLVGHNVTFDINICGAEFYRTSQTNKLEGYSLLDTMPLSVDYCKLPGGRRGGYKWPNLTELHQSLFSQSFDLAHNASADVEATARCFLELIRLEVIPPEKLNFSLQDLKVFQEQNPTQIQALGLEIEPYQKDQSPQDVAIQTKEVKEFSNDAQPIENSAANNKVSEFVHLHGHSQFSVLQSTASVQGIVDAAVSFGMSAVAMSDLGNMYGAFKFVDYAHKKKIKPIVACEFYIADDHSNKNVKDHQIQEVFIAKNFKGYQNLSKLCSFSHTEGFYYVPRIDKKLITDYKEGIMVLSGNPKGAIAHQLLNFGEEKALEEWRWWKAHFGDDFYVELSNHGLEQEDVVNTFFKTHAPKENTKCIAANNYFYIQQEDAEAHDILLCVKDGEKKSTPIGKGRDYRYGFPNNEFYFKSPDQMHELFKDYPEALQNIPELVSKVEYYPLHRDVLLPKFDIPSEFSSEDAYLRHLTYKGAEKRYGDLSDQIKERIDFELETIQKTGYPGYFLIVQDFTNKAKELGVSVGPGRGSAAGSVVAYCTGITNVDPIKYALLFERFLNPDRVSLPDIDIDFDDIGRSKIMQYVIDKYGKNQVAQIITYGSMAAKSSIRDAGRVLELPLQDTDRLAKLVPDTPGISLTKAFKEIKELRDIKDKSEGLESEVLKQAQVIEGSLRNTGIHACGVIITPTDMSDLIPVTTSKDSDLLATQYDNSVVESAGLLKMDFLGLKTLSVINKTVEIVKGRTGVLLDPDQFPLDDPKTFALYQKGSTNGTFQFESAGMQRYLKQLKPDTFEDLIAMNALYRPGPLEYIPNFIARKHGKEPIEYDLPEMEEFLSGTYGITVYQEQVMLLSQKLAGFSKGDADLLRKAMGKKIKALLDKLKPKFIDGCLHNGHPQKIAEKIWKDWEAFAAYAFNKSHSTCYSVIAFQTAYLKANYPEEYMAAVLTNNMSDIKKVTFFMEECKRMGIEVLGPDINESYLGFSVNKKNQVRFGLGAIKGVGHAAVFDIISQRKQNGSFNSVFDLVERVDLRAVNKKTIESLVLSGAFDLFGHTRSVYFSTTDQNDQIWVEKVIKYGQKIQKEKNSAQVSLFDQGGQTNSQDYVDQSFPNAKPWSSLEQLQKEREVVGVYLSGHPLDQYKIEFQNFCSVTIHALNQNLETFQDKEVCFAGIVTQAQHRTSKNGNPYGTFTIEGYKGALQIMLFSEDYVQHKNYMNQGWFLFVTAKVQKRRYRENELEVKVLRIELLQSIREKLTSEIHLKINPKSIQKEYIEQLSTAINTSSGQTTLKCLVSDVDSDTQVQFYAQKNRIKPTNTFLEELSRLEIPYRLIKKR